MFKGHVNGKINELRTKLRIYIKGSSSLTSKTNTPLETIGMKALRRNTGKIVKGSIRNENKRI